ncbi:MAG: GreA/GreB family elongation factor [Minisyncoccales bacterium]|jgi:transcription elongation factor GreA
MNEKKYYLTAEGLTKLKSEYEKLRRTRQLRIGGRDDAPSALHSEELNPEFVHFQDDLASIDIRLAELESVFKNTKPIRPAKGKVGIGAMVTVSVDGQEDKLLIVEALEADPAAGKISIESPVGKALLDKRAGEEVSISSPIETVYKIKKIDHFTS